MNLEQRIDKRTHVHNDLSFVLLLLRFDIQFDLCGCLISNVIIFSAFMIQKQCQPNMDEESTFSKCGT